MFKFKSNYLVILIIIIGTIYYQIDKSLFYYGKNNLNNYNLLPLKIQPEYRYPFEGGFALDDEDGFRIAAKEISYSVNNKTVLINKVLKYGFDAKQLIAVVIDSDKTKYNLEFSQDVKDSSEIKATMNIYNNLNNSHLYKWINIDGNDDLIWKLGLYRDCLTLLAIIIVITLFYRAIKYIKLEILKFKHKRA